MDYNKIHHSSNLKHAFGKPFKKKHLTASDQSINNWFVQFPGQYDWQ